MAKIQYIDLPLRANKLATIAKANVVIAEYQQQGYVITLRQLYYQFVQRGWIENNHNNYKTLGKAVNDGRVAGLIDWDAIEDRTRGLDVRSTWVDPFSMVRSADRWYEEDPWRLQPTYVEVWIEKDALVGVIKNVCDRRFVPYIAAHGYLSQSEAKVGGDRMGHALAQGKRVIMLHLGDHDPSGMDMTRDNITRLSRYAGEEIEVRRLALNMDQIEEYSPAPNYAKVTDTRYETYKDRFGSDECWELDALKPSILEQLIDDELDDIIDPDLWVTAEEDAEPNHVRMHKLVRNWRTIERWLDKKEE